MPVSYSRQCFDAEVIFDLVEKCPWDYSFDSERCLAFMSSRCFQQGMCDLLSVDFAFLILDLILAFWLDSCDCRALIATHNFSEDAVVRSGPLLCLALLASWQAWPALGPFVCRKHHTF